MPESNPFVEFLGSDDRPLCLHHAVLEVMRWPAASKPAARIVHPRGEPRDCLDCLAEARRVANREPLTEEQRTLLTPPLTQMVEIDIHHLTHHDYELISQTIGCWSVEHEDGLLVRFHSAKGSLADLGYSEQVDRINKAAAKVGAKFIWFDGADGAPLSDLEIHDW